MKILLLDLYHSKGVNIYSIYLLFYQLRNFVPFFALPQSEIALLLACQVSMLVLTNVKEGFLVPCFIIFKILALTNV